MKGGLQPAIPTEKGGANPKNAKDFDAKNAMSDEERGQSGCVNGRIQEERSAL